MLAVSPVFAGGGAVLAGLWGFHPYFTMNTSTASSDLSHIGFGAGGGANSPQPREQLP